MSSDSSFFDAMHVICIIISAINLIFWVLYLIVAIKNREIFLGEDKRNLKISFIIACFIGFFPYFFGPFDDNRISSSKGLCGFTALLTISGGWSITLLVFVTIIIFYLAFQNQRMAENNPFLFKYGFFIIIWSITIIFAISLLITNDYQANFWGLCVMKNSVLLNIYKYSIPVIQIVSALILIYIVLKIRSYLKQIKVSMSINSNMAKDANYASLNYYQFIKFFLLQAFCCVLYLIDITYYDDGKRGLGFVVQIGYSLYPGLALIIFLFNRRVFTYCKILFGFRNDDIEDNISEDKASSRRTSKISSFD